MDHSLEVYRLWFEYARRSDRAAWTQKVIDVFGDVWGIEFDAWWEDRSGYFLGPQPIPIVVIEDLDDYIRIGPGQIPELSEVVVICSLDYPKRTLMKAFGKLLDQEMEKKKGRPKFDDWGDIFNLVARPDTNALRVRLNVFDAREKGLSYVEIADTLKLIDRKTGLWEKSTIKDKAAQKAVKQSTVSRYLKEFAALVKNVELGVFPSKQRGNPSGL